MNSKIFSDYPDQARIWIYGFSNELSPAEQELVQQKLNEFISVWNSHGKDVKGAYSIWYDRFVILTASDTTVSGCSIDSSIEVFRKLKDKHFLDALDLNRIYYRNGNKIEAV